MRPLFTGLLPLLLFACGGTAPQDEVGATGPAGHGEADHEEAAQLYTCGMHPEVVQDHPGDCPICGMELEPVRRGGGPVVVVESGTRLAMGVRTGLVERRPVFQHVRTVGRIEVGEDEVSVVNLRFGGWVQGLRVERTGDPVAQGQVLFEIYAPDLMAAQEELLLARRQGDADLEASVRRKLALQGVASRDVEGILTAGQAQRTLPVRAPISGFVLHKNLVEGARVEAGKDLFRIGQLERIWVLAEVYEVDAPWVEEGQPAQVELPWQPGTVLEGRVAYVYPTLDPRTRTLGVRLELDNPGLRLKPGMFADVTIQVRREEAALAVPTEAILHSGTREIAFVEQGTGRFEARELRTGLVSADRHTEVLEGLEEGEEVVISGQFLIDSESQLQAALLSLRKPGSSPHPQPHSSEGSGGPSTGMYTCPMHPEVLQEGPGRCPECKMFLEAVPVTP
jgi:Cu(I)/Ag(I) efflux system membrane fusion protein